MAIKQKTAFILFLILAFSYSVKDTMIFAQSFSDEGCGGKREEDNADSYGPYSCRQKWSGDTLILECYADENCAAKIENAGYSIDNNVIKLRYKPHVFEPSANCNCHHKLIYEISNMVKKTYIIILENIGSNMFKKQK